jgi:hypothetical protein
MMSIFLINLAKLINRKFIQVLCKQLISNKTELDRKLPPCQCRPVIARAVRLDKGHFPTATVDLDCELWIISAKVRNPGL